MGDELLTVAEAGKALSVSIPRLRRLLARPEFASYSQRIDRQTRTGTRTATVIPISVLAHLRTEIEKQNEREQERERPNSFSSGSSEVSVYVQALLREKDARIAELTSALEHERQQSRFHAEAAARAQALAMLAGPKDPPKSWLHRMFAGWYKG